MTDFRGEHPPKGSVLPSSLQLGGFFYVGWRRRRNSSEIMKLNPFKFLQEVRQETNKVTWPSRKETGITTAMVFIFAALSAVFFLLADQVIRFAVTFVLGIGG
jgi:preprotein translocase subunit SecE